MESTHDVPKERKAQISNWEAHLASIIEKTSRNIEELSQPSTVSNVVINGTEQVNRVHSAINHSYSVSPHLPPPPPIHHPPSFVHVHATQQERLEETCHHALLSEGAVTRPIPKHVEEDLTKRIGLSIRRSMERAINERLQSSQSRVDDLTDRIESLSEDFTKVMQERDTLSRTLSMQDRISRRLKVEWENQKVALNRVESIMNEEKQATKEEMDHIMQRCTSELATRLTITQFQRAVVSLSSKTKAAVEKTALSLQNSYQSDLSLVKDELNTLKESQDELRSTVDLNKVKCETMLSTFDERHVKDIVGTALHGYFGMLEASTTSKVQSLLQSKLETQVKESVETTIKQNFERCINSYAIDDTTNVVFQKFATLIKLIIDEDAGRYLEPLIKKKVSQLLGERNELSHSHFKSVEDGISELLKRVESLEDHCCNGSNVRTKLGIGSRGEQQGAACGDDERIVKEYFQRHFQELQSRCETMIMQTKNTLHESVTGVESSLASLEQLIENKSNLVGSSTKAYVDKRLSQHDLIFKELKEKILDSFNSIAELRSSMASFLGMEKISSSIDSKLQSLSNEVELFKVTYSNEKIQFDNDIKTLREEWTKANNDRINKETSEYLAMKGSVTTMKKQIGSFEEKLSSLDATVFDTIQSMNALQLEQSKARESLFHDGNLRSHMRIQDEFESITSVLKKDNYELGERLESGLSKIKEDIVRIESSIIEVNSDTNARVDYQIQALKDDTSTLDAIACMEAKIRDLIDFQKVTVNNGNDLNALQVGAKDTEKAVDSLQSSFASMRRELESINVTVTNLEKEIRLKCHSFQQCLQNETNTLQNTNETTHSISSSGRIPNRIIHDSKENPVPEVLQVQPGMEDSKNEQKMSKRIAQKEDMNAPPIQSESNASQHDMVLSEPLFYESDSISGRVSTFDEEIIVLKDVDTEKSHVSQQAWTDHQPEISITFNTDDIRSLDQLSSFDEDESVDSKCTNALSSSSSKYESDFNSEHN